MRNFEISYFCYDKKTLNFISMEISNCRAQTLEGAEINFLNAQKRSSQLVVIKNTKHISK